MKHAKLVCAVIAFAIFGCASTLVLFATAKPDTQAKMLDVLAKGRKNAPRKPLADKSARAALATLAASLVAEIRTAARALEDTFVATVADDESLVPPGQLPLVEHAHSHTTPPIARRLSRAHHAHVAGRGHLSLAERPAHLGGCG